MTFERAHVKHHTEIDRQCHMSGSLYASVPEQPELTTATGHSNGSVRSPLSPDAGLPQPGSEDTTPSRLVDFVQHGPIPVREDRIGQWLTKAVLPMSPWLRKTLTPDAGFHWGVRPLCAFTLPAPVTTRPGPPKTLRTARHPDRHWRFQAPPCRHRDPRRE